MALTAPRNTPRMGGDIHPYDFPVAAGGKAWQGGIGAINASGLLVPASATAALVVVGRIRDSYDNTGGAASAFRVAVDSGIFGYLNSTAGDLITQADVGKDCYVVDDETVAKTDDTAARPRAGKVIALENGLVYVELKHAS